VGQTRQELSGRSGALLVVRCACCGEPLAGATAVVAVLREVGYEYCGEQCRDRHAELVTRGPDWCAYCDLDAVGDTDRCAAHFNVGLDAGITGDGNRACDAPSAW
jgi:hypothetical protein